MTWRDVVERDALVDGVHGIGRLREEERRLAIRVRAHLAGMVAIVTADAVHAPDRKAIN
jgi:hypothetical protein